MHFRPLNNTHQAWKHLTENLGYDHATNEITSLSTTKGFPVFLNKIVAVHETEDGEDFVDVSQPCDFGTQPFKYGYYAVNTRIR
jgi:hypothetical protein